MNKDHERLSAATDDLIERLRNPMWAHSTAPFPSPQLEQEENLAAMNEAVAEIERLRAVPQEVQQALDLAVNIIMAGEPGDSRAVSDEAVAIAAVACGYTSAAVMKVIRAALALSRPK